ncbi:4-hydroxyphenylpyruvate dioxygenase [bacterium]|nr:4-hydroxyphenylpyruvate dioxygenase [bacterium]
MDNPLQLKRIHHVEFWVGNAKQAAYYYHKAFGFDYFAYRGLETQNRELTSYVMRQNDIHLVLTTPMHPEHEINAHLVRHGDGVRDIAFEVDDVDFSWGEAVRRGAVPYQEPHWSEDSFGKVRRASIHTYGDTIHSFIGATVPGAAGSNGHSDYNGVFLPGYIEKHIPGAGCGLIRIDHMVGNVELGKMQFWADFYSNVMGFHRYITFDDKDISTEYSALMSIVMSSGNYVIKFPINEPAAGKKKSQIEEYLDFYHGPGVQHIALLTKDILETVDTLRKNGVEFLRVPETYYEDVPERVGTIQEPMDEVKRLNLLVDRDEDGYLLQLFSKPVEDRPTLFYEIIQRRGAKGFGKGNFKALFESIEREQALRGNL